MEDTNLTLEEFLGFCRSELQFLVTDYGFQESKNEDKSFNKYKVIFIKDDLRIEIEGINWGLTAVLTISDKNERTIGVGPLLPKDKTYPKKSRKYKSRAESQKDDISRSANILREYGKELLRGDPSVFDKAIRQEEAHWGAYEKRRSFGIAIQDALAAYKEEKWHTVTDLLQPYESKLSKKMLKRLNFARDQL